MWTYNMTNRGSWFFCQLVCLALVLRPLWSVLLGCMVELNLYGYQQDTFMDDVLQHYQIMNCFRKQKTMRIHQLLVYKPLHHYMTIANKRTNLCSLPCAIDLCSDRLLQRMCMGLLLIYTNEVDYT